MPRARGCAASLAVLLPTVVALAAPAMAEAGQLSGRVLSGRQPVGQARVEVFRAGPGGSAQPVALGSSRTRTDGSFKIAAPTSGRSERVLYLLAKRGGVVRLAAVLGTGPVHSPVVVNERTTVAAGFALAQFISTSGISGRAPGPQNAAAMARNLVDVHTGGIGQVLRSSPNGNETSTLRTFNSLANMIVPCAHSQGRCSQLFRLATPPRGAAPAGVLEAVANIARSPWQNVRRLMKLAGSGPTPDAPALGASQTPDAWTLALRFVGDGLTMSGPGNMAIDAKGNVWVTTNYDYSPDPFVAVCGSHVLLKFTPDGRYAKGSPYTGGGLSGAGFGITFDPRGDLWVGNFGFAAPGCPIQPPHNSMSEFAPSGSPISPGAPPDSPTGGYSDGSINWPQGTVSDRRGDIWIANCGNDTVTRYRAGDPKGFQNISGLGIEKPFDIAINTHNQVFVTGNKNDTVGMLNPNGTPTARSPIKGGGLNTPLGIAADSRGNMWVANSAVIDVPCPGAVSTGSHGAGSLTLIGADGQVRSPAGFKGGGLTIPWGIAVDGNDNVWVANFAGKRLSQFCGTKPDNCPPGTGTGNAISPGTGYGFDGLARNTGVQIDPSGNVWVANNWKQVPVQTNPGGYQMVVFLGLAGPLRTPLIGPPASP
ncbi:MAG: pknD [Solirubrobacteraceae bacterium]|nr:pknD [Solirubrobacteraceae bacterium]